MENKNQIKLFKDHKIRAKWDEDKEDWYFSVIDVVGVLSESKNPTSYWSTLKQRLIEEGAELITICDRLKLPAKDGKLRLTDVADNEQILRIIQSIPSPNAEPFKRWLAKVGKERLDEIADPELAIDRAIKTYQAKGMSDKWITQRLKSVEFRKELTDEWKRSGVVGVEYAILTDEISEAWSGMTTKEYKKHKRLKKENLRDNMSNAELVLNMLAEVSTTQISKSENPEGFEESKKIAKRGGGIAGNARKELEEESGKKIITKSNSKNPKLLDKK